MKIAQTLYQNCSKENQKVIDLFFNDIDKTCDSEGLVEKFKMEKTNPFFPFLYQKELKEKNFSFMINEFREAFFILNIPIDMNHVLKLELYLKSIEEPSSLICNFLHLDYQKTYNPPHSCAGGLVTYYEYSRMKKEWKCQQVTNGLSIETTRELKKYSTNHMDLDNVVLINNFLDNFSEPQQMLNGILLSQDIDISKNYIFNKSYEYAKLFN